MSAPGAPPLTVRPMADDDLDAVVELLDRALGPAPAGVDRRALFVWKHLDNPFGRSIALVAETDGRLAGLRAFMRWRLRAPDGSECEAVRAVDTATAPDAQRRGVFSTLTREALQECARQGVAVVFNTPNAKSLPGYLKLGWRPVARWPLRIRAHRPVRLVGATLRRDLRPGPGVEPRSGRLVGAADRLAGPGQGLDELLRLPGDRTLGLHTPRTREYLRWRYAAGPMRYHVLEDDRALVVTRLRRRGRLMEAVVCEALARPGGDAAVRGLLRALPAAAGADHALTLADSPWTAEAARAGYRRIPRAGITFVVRPVTPRSGPDPLVPSSWALTLGDLEVF